MLGGGQSWFLNLRTSWLWDLLYWEMGEKTVFKHPFFKPVEYRFQHPATNFGFQRQTSFRWLCLCGPITYVFHPFHHPVPASKILVVVFTCTYHYVCNQGWTRKKSPLSRLLPQELSWGGLPQKSVGNCWRVFGIESALILWQEH